MVILIMGASHTGKTVLAQRLLEELRYPYLSIDHLKMGLIRSGRTNLTVEDDDALTEELWPILREMVKTVIEKDQNLIVEGAYIPSDWQKDFSEEYRKQIRSVCLVMSERYIRTHFDRIRLHANDVENRLDDSSCTEDWLIRENAKTLAQCQKFSQPYRWIDEAYDFTEDVVREFSKRSNENERRLSGSSSI